MVINVQKTTSFIAKENKKEQTNNVFKKFPNMIQEMAEVKKKEGLPLEFYSFSEFMYQFNRKSDTDEMA